MALYNITLRATYFAQQCINVFSYLSGGTLGAEPSAFDLLKALGFVPEGDPLALPAGTMFDAVRGLVNANVLFTEVECMNLYSTTDFYSLGYSPAVSGVQVGQAETPVVAFGLRSNRVRTDVRRGFKRFVGVGEDATDAGGVLSSGYRGFLALVATRMSEVVEGDFDANYAPAVFAFDKYTTPKGNVAYKQFPTEAEQIAHTASPVTWAGYDQVRSQTSRQYNRGT